MNYRVHVITVISTKDFVKDKFMLLHGIDDLNLFDCVTEIVYRSNLGGAPNCYRYFNVVIFEHASNNVN